MADEQSGQGDPAPAESPKPADELPAVATSPVQPVQPVQIVEDVGYTPSGVPTFDSVREKIETRYGTALGSHELAADTPEGRGAAEQYEARQKAAAERLEQIRSSMHSDPDEDRGDA